MMHTVRFVISSTFLVVVALTPACGGKVRYCSDPSDGLGDCFTDSTKHHGSNDETDEWSSDVDDQQVGDSADTSSTGPDSTTGTMTGTGTSSTTGAVSTTDTTTTTTTTTTSDSSGTSYVLEPWLDPYVDNVDGPPCQVQQLPDDQATVRCPYLGEFVEPWRTSSDALLVSVLNQTPDYSSGDCVGTIFTIVLGADSDGNGQFAWDEATEKRTICAQVDYFIYSQYDLVRLSGTEHIYGDLYVTGSDVYDLSPLSSLKQVDGYLTIAGTSVSDLNALQGLVYVGADLQISSNPNLQNLGGLKSLRQVGSIYIYDNDALSSLAGLDSIWSADNVTLIDNDALSSLDGLGGLEVVFGEMWVERNDILMSLRALTNLNAVDSYVTFSYNRSLAPCEVDWLFYENSISFGASLYQVGSQGTGVCP